MKVLYDHQSFTGLKYGGVARYYYELMNVFSKRKDVEFELALQYSNNDYINGAAFSRHRNFSTFFNQLTTAKVMSLVNRLNSLRLIRQGGFDIFHPTYYHKYFLDHIGDKPFVLTFHDSTNEKYHHLYPSLGGDLHDLKQQLLNRAHKVIAVSEATKADMLHYFDVDESKVEVIYHGSAFTNIIPNGAATKLKIPERYLLYVGNRSDFKNFPFFLGAIQPLLKKDNDLFLICAGGKRFTREEKQLLSDLSLTEKVIYHDIPNDEVLYVLYQKAIAFIFPSLNEGFGIPILEAFSAGCPVALSDASSFPEVAQQAGIYFDPKEADSILATVEKLVEDESLRIKLIEQGYSRLQHFSTEKTAQQTLEVYRQAIQSN
ncbi:MAG: glycosyltransferase family 1 protein [Spirosomataceae bacterium]